MVPNTFKVSKRQWKKWSPFQQRLFNNLYETMTDNQDLFTHPKTNVPNTEWKTVAWNSSWMAAELSVL